MFDRCLDGETRTPWRHGFQQEAIHLAAIDEVHEHFAVVTTARNNRYEPRRSLAQVLRQLLDFFADHGGIDNGANGVRGTREKDITLAFAEDLRDRIARYEGAQVFMTRGPHRPMCEQLKQRPASIKLPMLREYRLRNGM